MAEVAKESAADERRKTAQQAGIQVKGLPIPGNPRTIIAAELEKRIRTGVYAPGAVLPSLADMERMTDGTARNTIRAALKVLIDKGLVTSVAGMGTYVLGQEFWDHGPARS